MTETTTINQAQSEVPPLQSTEIEQEARAFVDLLFKHVPISEDCDEFFSALALLFRRASLTGGTTARDLLSLMARFCYQETRAAEASEQQYLARRMANHAR